MRRLAMLLIVLGGILVLGVVVAVADNSSPPINSSANIPPEGATYVGSETCFQCHSGNYRDWSDTFHSKMIQDPAADPAAVIADFSVGEDVRQGEIGGETRTYSAEDVTLTLGSKHTQRYIMQTEDGGYMVLPGQWNVESAAWVAAEPADWLNDCAGCHTTGFNAESLTWSETSVTCESCHGPGSVHVEAAQSLPDEYDPSGEEVYDVRQQIVSTVDSAVCAQCHTRGTSADGEHGYPVGYVVGGPLDETMFVPVAPTGAEDDPNFWPNGSEKEYRQQAIALSSSAHGNALHTIRDNGLPESCLSCHSTDYITQDTTFPQDVVTLETAQFGITCVSCHAPHGEEELESQLAEDSYVLCTTCHTGTSGGTRRITAGSEVHHPMREMFEGRPFLGLDASPDGHFANDRGPVCASCHMPHTVISDETGGIASHTFHIVLPTEAAEGQVDSCTTCHSPERSEENTPENLTFAVTSVQEDTRERVEDIRAELDPILEANPDWDVRAEEKSEQQQLAERIVTLVTFVESDGSWGFHNPDYADEILSDAEDTLDELLDLMEE